MRTELFSTWYQVCMCVMYVCVRAVSEIILPLYFVTLSRSLSLALCLCLSLTILDTHITGAGKHETYTRLADFTDTIGPRVSGSVNLENAVQYMLTALRADGLDNVHAEPVMIPK